MLILNIITLANLILLFTILFYRKNNSLPNKILALILINPGINFLSNITILSGHFFSFPYFYFFAQCTCFLFAPLVYTYVNLFTNNRVKLRDPLFAITAVCIGVAIYFCIDFAFLPAAAQNIYLNGVLQEPYPTEMVISNSLFILMQQVYFTVSAIRVYRYSKRIREQLSNFEKTRVAYISRFIALIWLMNLITIGLYATLPTTQVEYVYLPLVLTAIYFYILTCSFNQNSVFTKQGYEDYLADNTVSPAPAPTIEEKDLSELKDLVSLIEHYIREEEPFTNPDLTIDLLAKEMKLSVNRLSAAINRGFGKSFYDLINEKRVEKSKQLLREMNAHDTIEYLAYRSGFNSRASFYRAFKKHTGITPTEFLKTELI